MTDAYYPTGLPIVSNDELLTEIAALRHEAVSVAVRIQDKTDLCDSLGARLRSAEAERDRLRREIANKPTEISPHVIACPYLAASIRDDALLADFEQLRSDYAALVEHHRQSELAGTKLADWCKALVVAGYMDDALTDSIAVWDAHEGEHIIYAACADDPDCPVILRHDRDANYAAWLKVSDELDEALQDRDRLRDALRELLDAHKRNYDPSDFAAWAKRSTAAWDAAAAALVNSASAILAKDGEG